MLMVIQKKLQPGMQHQGISPGRKSTCIFIF